MRGKSLFTVPLQSRQHPHPNSSNLHGDTLRQNWSANLYEGPKRYMSETSIRDNIIIPIIIMGADMYTGCWYVYRIMNKVTVAEIHWDWHNIRLSIYQYPFISIYQYPFIIYILLLSFYYFISILYPSSIILYHPFSCLLPLSSLFPAFL